MGKHFKVYQSSKFCFSEIWVFLLTSLFGLSVFSETLERRLSAQITQEEAVSNACCLLHQRATHLASHHCDQHTKAQFPTKDNGRHGKYANSALRWPPRSKGVLTAFIYGWLLCVSPDARGGNRPTQQQLPEVEIDLERHDMVDMSHREQLPPPKMYLLQNVISKSFGSHNQRPSTRPYEILPYSHDIALVNSFLAEKCQRKKEKLSLLD